MRETDEGSIKTALLLFDKLDKPSNNVLIGKDDSEDITGLGLASQSKATFASGPDPRQITNYVWETFKKLDDREPGKWSLWSQYGEPVLPEDRTSPGLAFQLRLTSGLIVPSPSTPFEDIIQFKDKHRDELISLRHHIEELAIKLSKVGDIREINLEVERFDDSLSNYLEKARQSNVRKAIASLTTELDWAAAVRSVMGGGGGGFLAAAQNLSLTASAMAVGGGILAGLSVKSVAGVKNGPSPFRYLARIEKEYGA